VHGVQLFEPYLVSILNFGKVLAEFEELLVELGSGVGYYEFHEVLDHEILTF